MYFTKKNYLVQKVKVSKTKTTRHTWGGNRDIAGAAGWGGVLSTFYVLMWGCREQIRMSRANTKRPTWAQWEYWGGQKPPELAAAVAQLWRRGWRTAGLAPGSWRGRRPGGACWHLHTSDPLCCSSSTSVLIFSTSTFHSFCSFLLNSVWRMNGEWVSDLASEHCVTVPDIFTSTGTWTKAKTGNITGPRTGTSFGLLPGPRIGQGLLIREKS